MAGFPEVFIPLLLRGDVSFWHDFTNTTLVAGSTLRITHGPPTRGFYYIYFLNNYGSPRRTDTDEVVRTTNAFLRHWLIFPGLPSQPILEHQDFLMESVYRPDYPVVAVSTFDHPQIIEFVNNEVFNISWDITFRLLEASKKVYDENILPYFKGQYEFHHAFGDPTVAKGMAEFFKLWSREDVRRAWLAKLGLT